MMGASLRSAALRLGVFCRPGECRPADGLRASGGGCGGSGKVPMGAIGWVLPVADSGGADVGVLGCVLRRQRCA